MTNLLNILKIVKTKEIEIVGLLIISYLNISFIYNLNILSYSLNYLASPIKILKIIILVIILLISLQRLFSFHKKIFLIILLSLMPIIHILFSYKYIYLNEYYYNVIIITITYFVFKNNLFLKKYIHFASLGIILGSLLYIYRYFFRKHPPGTDPFAYDIGFPFGIISSNWSMYLCIYFLLFFEIKKDSKCVYLNLIFLISMILSGGRSGFIIAFIGIIIYYLKSKNYRYLIISLSVILLAVMYKPDYSSKVSNQSRVNLVFTKYHFGTLEKPNDILLKYINKSDYYFLKLMEIDWIRWLDRFSAWRIYQVLYSFDYLIKSPLGVPDKYAKVTAYHNQNKSFIVHNTFLYLGMRYGIFTLFIALFMMGFIFYKFKDTSIFLSYSILLMFFTYKFIIGNYNLCLIYWIFLSINSELIMTNKNKLFLFK